MAWQVYCTRLLREVRLGVLRSLPPRTHMMAVGLHPACTTSPGWSGWKPGPGRHLSRAAEGEDACGTNWTSPSGDESPPSSHGESPCGGARLNAGWLHLCFLACIPEGGKAANPLLYVPTAGCKHHALGSWPTNPGGGRVGIRACGNSSGLLKPAQQHACLAIVVVGGSAGASPAGPAGSA